jgi:hypothetical protein
VAELKPKDFARDGSHWTLQLSDIGGKVREIPVRRDLAQSVK